MSKSKKAEMSKKKKITRIVTSAISWSIFIIVAIALIIVFVQLVTGKSPALFGYRYYYVMTGSMSPEIEPGEVILSKAYNKKTGKPQIEIGDVVTYIIPEGNSQAGRPNTHKVIKAPYVNDNGELYIQTKGTNNAIPDTPIPITSVQSVMIRKSATMTFIYSTFTNRSSLLVVLMIIPLVLTIVTLIYRLVVIAKSKPEEKEEEVQSLSEEEYKAKVISDYLKSAEKNKADIEPATLSEATLDNLDISQPQILDNNQDIKEQTAALSEEDTHHSEDANNPS